MTTSNEEKKFIYVFTIDDKAKMLGAGYNLIKTDSRNNIFIFENDPESTFDLSKVIHIKSDVLTYQV